MKLVKFLTRNYTLLEISLIDESLLKKNTSIPGIYHQDIIDISKKGLVDIYITKEDRERTKKWINRKAEEKGFFRKKLEQGLKATKNILDLPEGLLKKDLDDREAIKELIKLKEKMLDYGGFLDFTTYIDQLNPKMDKESMIKLAEFHDYRKKAFVNYFNFLKKLCDRIAAKKGLNPATMDYLVFSEIIDFLKGKIGKKEINEMQKKRKQKYIVIWEKGKRTIITDNFEKEVKKIKKLIEEDEIREIKGKPINKGAVKGRVKIIKQTDSLKNIKEGKIIVTQMTNPEMTPILKKCKAIVTDEGGFLCHAAYIAREFGIIAIIGTRNATKILKDGDYIEVDADKGIVRKL